MTKVLPGALNPDEIYARLREPFGYWNSVGLAAAMGLPGCCGSARAATGHGALNALACAGRDALRRDDPPRLLARLAARRGDRRGAVVRDRAAAAARRRGARARRARAARVVAVWTFGQTGLSDDRVDAGGARGGRATSSASRSPSCSSSCSPCRWRSTFWAAEHPPTKETRREAGAVILILLALAPIAVVGALALLRPRPRRLRLEHAGGR